MLDHPISGSAIEAADHEHRSTLVQLVPRRMAAPSGVADYASALAQALRGCGVNTIFLSATLASEATVMQDESKTIVLPKRQAQCLADTLDCVVSSAKASAVLLHFVGYGYQKRGAPLWLLNGLRMWGRRASRVPLITMFHELYATGRPWQSSFWLSPIQMLIARGLLDLSSAAITTTGQFREWLLQRNSEADVRCMPVFSNVGEPGRGLPPSARAASAVVFGLAGVENRVFGLFRQDVERVVMSLGIEKILDIGPRNFSTPATLGGAPLISKGALPRHAVSELLQQARYGIIAYPFDVLGKSGVFAAYAAHGMVPIVFPDRRGSFDGLGAGRHFLDGLQLRTAVDGDRLAVIQSQLSDWYAAHSLRVQAGLLERMMNQATRTSQPVATLVEDGS